MSHNPQASESFKLPQQPPPLTDNVHKLLENCRRRAREHGVTQFTGNADGLFGNELEVALIADGKAVAPEVNPDKYVEDLIEHYGHGLGGALLGAEFLRRLYDVLRPHMERNVPKQICGQLDHMSHAGARQWNSNLESAISDHALSTGRTLRQLSQYGIRAVVHPTLHTDDHLLPQVLYYLNQYLPGTAEELRLKFPLS